MEERFRPLSGQMVTNPGASEAALAELGEKVRVALPDDYLAFLLWSNGAEGEIGTNYLRLWPAEEIAADPYPYEDDVPGLLFFASDGGEALFGFNTRAQPMPVVVTHQDDLDPATLVPLAGSFEEFLAFLTTQRWSEYWANYRRGAGSGS